MLKAFVAKLPAVVAAVAAVWLLPAGWVAPALVAIAAALIGFFVYAIAHPHSQFFIPVVDRVASDAPVVALTFDDGPDPVVTPRILDLLRAHGARATFFVLGERAARHPDVIRQIHREGHTVGTHTQHHQLRFHFAAPGRVRREIEDAVDVVAGILPTRPTLFRPPQGLRTPSFASGWRLIRGLICVTWSVRGFDSRPTTADAIVARVARRLAPGAIVALHDGTGLGGGTDRAPTLAALSRILGECRARGLRCVALDDAARGIGVHGA
ncbi:MAG TPA: polysaccharide deacetylase family protein [Kofleriaceae bacterium]|jgi:peptidoglycan/xylan/chitin deacetylase (PgdA/CDA1 family)|nr:polysaccharide deacetylase family protein [Kofleriaceae bacterium]